MSWTSALRKSKSEQAPETSSEVSLVPFELAAVDWARLVSLDFETFYDVDYTLSKLSTSEYVRDPRFKAQMVGIKIGHKKTKWYAAKDVKKAVQAINWNTHSLLCHNTAFDGLILSHHYGVVPVKYYCTMSMARGLHSNEIGAGLDEVARFYGGRGKLDGVLETTKGVRDWSPKMNQDVGGYCVQDVDEMYDIFVKMHAKFPADEMDLVDLTIRMFADPVLKVDLPRVEKELQRELARREDLFYSVLDPKPYYEDKEVLKTRAERALTGKARDMLIIKRVIGSNEKFAAMLRAEGIEPPVKISPAWIKKSAEEREDADKWGYAFAKDDAAFTSLPENVDLWRGKLNPNKKADIPKIAAKQERLANLVACRLAVKSTTNITRAQRFLTAGANGMSLPCGYAYARAHTLRWGGNNKMNMQNLTRGGELRLSIQAAKGHVIGVKDSGQIEARVNGWLWGQDDLLDAFRTADLWDKSKGVARGDDRDAYCRFADSVYGYEVTTEHKLERFVGKVCVLGLGFQMGALKLQMTLAKGALGGPPVFFELDHCKTIISTYRRKNHKIELGWKKCARIIEDMAAGRTGTWKCISWEKDIIHLPNGLSLKYPGLRKGVNEDNGYEEWTYQAGEIRKKIYGGLLCENLVQALARIIVGWQMLQISRKYRVVMTTHDEVVNMVKKTAAAAWDKFSTKWMMTAPSWCVGIPLNCEGGYADNYSK